MRAVKFRQAAFVYLHVAVLYEAAAYVMFTEGIIPSRFGPPVAWLLVGGAVGAGIFYALLRWQNPWLARILWGVNVLRLPAMIRNAFFADETAAAPAFYVIALVVILINAWMLARAGWDL
jgi:ABC-type thiamin/hydroxymethylpyrimidine transport system permease subunit